MYWSNILAHELELNKSLNRDSSSGYHRFTGKPFKIFQNLYLYLGLKLRWKRLIVSMFEDTV